MKFALRLEERQPDRVFVTVCLSPEADAVDVQGVAVELRTRAGEPLGARLMLPVRGQLASPLALKTELRARDVLPHGSEIRGVAWWAGGQVETIIPTDPGTCMEAYCRGGGVRLDPIDPDDLPVDLHRTERAALERAFPWMRGFRAPDERPESQILEEQPADLAADIASCYGLCDEDKAFLEELLADDEDDEFDARMIN